MKIKLTEQDLNILTKCILNEMFDENSRNLSKKRMAIIRQMMDDAAKSVYGDEYGQHNDKDSEFYNTDVYNNANVASGIFSVGNQKLSDDTLIINFTSALGCPSMKVCPVSQEACYAVAGENRLPDVRRKNVIVQNLWKRAARAHKLDEIFAIARKYIELLSDTRKPIKFIRFNEAGDFPNQTMLIAAGKFAKWARDNYGVMSMAYTAKGGSTKAGKYIGIDPTAEIDGEPIDQIIRINRSRKDIPASPDTPNPNFFAIPMDFESTLADNDKVKEISDSELNHLKVEKPIANDRGIMSIPSLNYGRWAGGEGWYYVCPCSFWKYNKDKAEEKFYQEKGIIPPDATLSDKERKAIQRSLDVATKKELKKITNKIKSPCGVECAVCHDIKGGITPNGEIIKDYAVLTATHGSNKGKFNAEYAALKRDGKDDEAVYSKDNEYGLWWKKKQNMAKQSAEANLNDEL